MKLSENFTYSEFVKSQTAERKDIDNDMGARELENAISLAENVLQPVRDHFGTTVINSGYRSPDLNRAIGGSTGSQHCSGEAADIEVPGVSTHDLFKWIKDNLKFDQMILEFYDPEVPDSGWVHVSYKREGTLRNELLMALKKNGNTKYRYYREDQV